MELARAAFIDRKEKRMANDITGRDSFLITEALATALVALERLPADRQPKSNMDDLRKLLAAAEPANVSLHLARAKCRLFPHLDPMAVYREYGIGQSDDRD
jgi:hypothetical protein